MMKLARKDLLRTLAYCNGEWVAGHAKQTFVVDNPYRREPIAAVADLDAQDTEVAIAAAAEAFKRWRALAAGERAAILRRWYELQLAHLDDLAQILTSEQGKPLAEARGEIRYGASFVEWFAEEAKRIYGDVIPGHATDKRIVVLKQPVGVVGAITPWNFPHAMITRKVAPALAAGCTVVIKPAEATPLSALALAVLAEEAGFPPGVFNLITTSNPQPVGQVLTQSPVVRKLSFTGSTAVGKQLMAQSAATVKKVSLELGGNAPFIVLDDADVEAAVTGAIASKFRNAGQTCVCANRIYVQSGIAEAFTSQLTQAVQALKVGDGYEADTDVGPIINEAGLEKIERLVRDALAHGAVLATGGQRLTDNAQCYQPTVLTQVRTQMAISREEIFGPIATVFTFDTDDEVLQLANATPFGLAAYFYGRDYNRIWRLAEGLEYGMVGINTGMISTAVAPFGGVKESGFGREGSKYGIEEYVELKYLCWGLD
jgi:succinate-semialdehyde dehydrogenase/glutarate-semialdehyde dehydrogenase